MSSYQPRTEGKSGESIRRPTALGAGAALLGVALLTGLGLRLGPIVLAGFPLGDGGFFVTLARDLRASGLALPDTSTYNAAGIPFAYPPLGVYILAMIPGDPIETERWLPLVWSLLAIVGAYLLARELRPPIEAGIAAFVFAVMPVTWAIEGGGVTRALGFALFLLALWRFLVLVRQPSATNALVTGMLAALALQSHPQLWPALLASPGLLFLRRPTRRGVMAGLGSILVATALTAPWVALTVGRHGLEPFITAMQSHDTAAPLVRLLSFGPSRLGSLDFVPPLAIVGIALAIPARAWLVPAWLVLLLFLPGGEGRYSALPFAILASAGILAVLRALRPLRADSWAAGMGIAVAIAAGAIAGYQQFRPLPMFVRTAMTLTREQSSADARFSVITDDGDLQEALIDWFPTLTGRVSVGTYMGLEWTTLDQWRKAVELSAAQARGPIPDQADHVFRVTDGIAKGEPITR